MDPVERLRHSVATVVTPEQGDFVTRSRPWNLAVPQRALAVAEPGSTDDVVALVRAAREAGLTLAPQASGHGASGNTADTVLVRTHRMRGVEVEPGRRRARVGAGVRWGELQSAAASYGLTGLPGSSPVVTVAGYTLGGGLSWFGRRHGWAADGVLALDVVDAHGVARRVTADDDPDLFWALRGGGGDFAFVTGIELELHPAPDLYGGRMTWPAAAAADVLGTFREVAPEAPAELTLWYELQQLPGAEPVVAVDAAYLGDEVAAKTLLAPFDRVTGRLGDTRRALTLDQLGSITAEPTDPSPGASRGELLTTVDDEVATVLLDGPVAPLLTVQLRQLGGALAGPSDTPAGPLEEPYALYMLGIPTTPDVAAALRDRQGALVDALGPRVSGRKPFTFLAPGDSAEAAFRPAALERLRRLKRERDPAGVFRSNYPVG